MWNVCLEHKGLDSEPKSCKMKAAWQLIITWILFLKSEMIWSSLIQKTMLKL